MALEAGQAQETEGTGGASPPPITDTDTLVTSRRASAVIDMPPLYEVDIAEAEEQQQQVSAL